MKKAKKKAVRKKAIVKHRIADEQMQDLRGAVVAFRFDAVSRLQAVTDSRRLTQADLLAALSLARLRDIAAEGYQSYSDAILRLHADGKGFAVEHGRIALTIDQESKVTPRWKEEAEEREKALHLLARLLQDGKVDDAREALAGYGGMFDSSRFEQSVRSRYMPHSAWRLKLTESL